MKIALLICGQSRFFKKGYESIKEKIIDQYNPDIYIHTWKYKNNYAYSSQWNNLGKIKIDENDINEYIELYKPIKYKIENSLDSIPLTRNYEKTSSKYTKYNFYSYLYSLNQCYNLIENKQDYNIYIIIRSDVMIYNFPKPNLEYIQFWNRLPDRDEVIDTVMVNIPNKFIDIYLDIINNLDIYYDKGYAFNYEELMHAHFYEQQLYKYTLKLNRDEFEWGLFRNEHIENMI
jgi:hypothetical protein